MADGGVAAHLGRSPERALRREPARHGSLHPHARLVGGRRARPRRRSARRRSRPRRVHRRRQRLARTEPRIARPRLPRHGRDARAVDRRRLGGVGQGPGLGPRQQPRRARSSDTSPTPGSATRRGPMRCSRRIRRARRSSRPAGWRAAAAPARTGRPSRDARVDLASAGPTRRPPAQAVGLAARSPHIARGLLARRRRDRRGAMASSGRATSARTTGWSAPSCR